MQSLPAIEALVPQFSHELKRDASRLSGSNEEAALPGSDAGMDALLSVWTAVFQQQIMPKPEEPRAGEVRFDSMDPANGEGMKAASSKQVLSLQSEMSSTTGFPGSITDQAAILWQQVPMLGGLTTAATILKNEQETELPVVSAESARASSLQVSMPIVAEEQKELPAARLIAVKGGAEELHLSSEGKTQNDRAVIASNLPVIAQGGDGLAEESLPDGIVAFVESIAVPEPAADAKNIDPKPKQIGDPGTANLPAFASQNALPGTAVIAPNVASSRRSSVDGGKADVPVEKADGVAETHLTESPLSKPMHFDTELSLKREGFSRFKLALDRAAIPVLPEVQSEAEKQGTESLPNPELTATPGIPQATRPVEMGEPQKPNPEQDLPIENMLPEQVQGGQPKEQAILTQGNPELPKRELPESSPSLAAAAKSLSARMAEVKTPLPMASGEAKTISIRIPLTDANLAGAGVAQHIDLVFNNRNSNLTLQFHSPSAEIQQRIEESMPSLLDKLQTADWTSKPREAGAGLSLPEAPFEARKRAEAFLPTGQNPEPAQGLPLAAPSGQQGSSLGDSSANRREQNAQNPAGRNRKKDQAWQSELDEQLEP